MEQTTFITILVIIAAVSVFTGVFLKCKCGNEFLGFWLAFAGLCITILVIVGVSIQNAKTTSERVTKCRIDAMPILVNSQMLSPGDINSILSNVCH